MTTQLPGPSFPIHNIKGWNVLQEKANDVFQVTQRELRSCGAKLMGIQKFLDSFRIARFQFTESLKYSVTAATLVRRLSISTCQKNHHLFPHWDWGENEVERLVNLGILRCISVILHAEQQAWLSCLCFWLRGAIVTAAPFAQAATERK